MKSFGLSIVHNALSAITLGNDIVKRKELTGVDDFHKREIKE